MIFFFFKKHESTKFFLNILIEENVPCKVQAWIQFINSDNLVVNIHFKECIQIISAVPGGRLLGLVYFGLPGPSRKQSRLSKCSWTPLFQGRSSTRRNIFNVNKKLRLLGKIKNVYNLKTYNRETSIMIKNICDCSGVLPTPSISRNFWKLRIH